MPVWVRNQVRLVEINRSSVIGLASRILSIVGESTSEVSLTFMGDRGIRRLNHQYRKKDRPTDVLAFATREARAHRALRGKSIPLGDVVISIPTAARQARKENRPLHEEVTVLLVHGILHLCGYDHERSEAEAHRMRRRERTVLNRLGRIPLLFRR